MNIPSFKAGFSLIELMITVAIIGILAAIAVPSYQTYVGRAKLADLLNAISLGQNMVEDYLQSTGAIDCSNMSTNGNSTIQIPITSPNIQIAAITTVPAGLGTTSCTIVAIGAPIAFGAAGGFLAHAEENMPIPSIRLASYSRPQVQLVRAKTEPGSTRTNVPPILLSIPIISGGNTSWTVYSNGSSAAPASIPVLPGLGGGKTDGGYDGKGGGEPVK